MSRAGILKDFYSKTERLGTNHAETVLITLSCIVLRKEKKTPIEDEENKSCGHAKGIPSSPVKSRRSSGSRYKPQCSQCLFCERYDEPINLHCAATLKVDKNVSDCAILLKDTKLLSKPSAGDLIAIEAKYLVNCLVKLYNKARPLKNRFSNLVVILGGCG